MGAALVAQEQSTLFALAIAIAGTVVDSFAIVGTVVDSAAIVGSVPILIAVSLVIPFAFVMGKSVAFPEIDVTSSFELADALFFRIDGTGANVVVEAVSFSFAEIAAIGDCLYQQVLKVTYYLVVYKKLAIQA